MSSLTFLACVCASATAFAQAELVPVESPKGTDAAASLQGWNPSIALTSSATLISNSNVIGQINGISSAIAIGIVGSAEYVHGRHYLTLSGLINEGYTRTPVIPRFVKSTDIAKVDGVYNYFWTPFLGGYGRASIATSLFPTDAVTPVPQDWIDVTGATPVTLKSGVSSFRIADGFQPFTINESAGAFADPVRKEEFGLAFRLGIGGRHTFAQGAYFVHTNPMDPSIELLDLADVEQLGIEGFAGTSGKLEHGNLVYKAGLAVLLPFVNDDKYNRSATFLTRVAFEGDLTYKFSAWLSLVYTALVTRDPQLFPIHKEEVQIQNTALLTFQLGLVKKKEAPKAAAKEQLLIDAEKARAAAAELRAAAAEAKLKALEEASPPAPPAPPPAPPPPPGDPLLTPRE